MKIPNVLKIFAIVLTFALLLQVMPMSAFSSLAEELNQPVDATEFVSDNDEKPAEDAYIMFEDENKRELSSKQFRMSDGSFMAVSYPEQVHFIDSDGKYADVDNRLEYSEAKEENDFSGYSNRSNSFDIKFNEALFAENAVIYRLTKGDHKLSLERIQGENSYISNANANATVTQAKDDAEPFEKEGDAAGELAFVSSKISYSNEENNVDFDYVLIGNHVNEYIVIKEKLDTYTFTYRIDAEGLTAEKDENGGILFTDENGETIYSVPAPFMYDNNGVYSDAVDYDLTETDGAYILTVQADESWINEEDRVFPVTIDPDLYIGKYTSSDVDDADIWQGAPNQLQGGYQYMTCGYSNYVGDKEMRILVKINSLPSLPNASVIVDARLNMKQLYAFGDPTKPVFEGTTPIDFAARRITSAWSESTVTWNTKPSVYSTILDYRTATTSTPGCYLAFDITEAAVMWYNGTATNYGIEISTMETLNGYHYTYFCSSENPNQYSTVLPLFKLSYRDNKGIEDYWTFHSASAADAGSVYVNDFTGNPVVMTELFTTPGNIMPISIGLVYNGYLAGKYFTSGNAITSNFTNMKLGAGFKLSVQETVVSTTVGGRTYYVHSDSDGTEHYYYNFDNGSTYYSEDGLGWNITLSGSNKILSDEYGNKKAFNSSGYLTKIEDADGNTQTYTYVSGYAGRLSSIKSTPSGSTSNQTVDFSYTNGFLTSVINGSDRYEISYSNTTPNRITSITRSIYYNGLLDNGGSVTFNYSGNRLNGIVSDSTGKSANISYDAKNRVSTLFEKSGIYTGQTIGFTYSTDRKTQIQTSGNDDIYGNSDDIYTTYVFDYYGRTVTAYTKDLDGNVVSASNAAYNTETGKSKAVNGISKSGSVGASSINLLKNSSFESYSEWNGLQFNGSYSIVEEQSCIGKKAAKLTVSNATSASAMYSQSVSLTAGKTYTLSAYVKTSDVVGDGAYVFVSGITGAESMKITGTTDTSIQNGWQRIYCTFTAPTTQSYWIYIYLNGTSGTAYFDAVQLEEGSIGAYNLLENGAFINGSTGWTFAGSAFAGVSSYAPEYAVWLPGNHSGSVTTTQTVQLNMPVNTTYMLSAWAVGNSADIDVYAHTVGTNNNVVDYDQKTRTFQVKATIYYYTSSNTLSSTTTEGIAKFNPDTNQLQYSITPVVPNATAVGSLSKQAYAVIEISYNNNINDAQFLNISFTAEPAQTYKYDSNGNLTGIQNADGNTPSYEFANGVDLSKVSNSDGSNYTISYYTETNATHRIKEIKDASNVIAAYEYYANGNVKKVSVSPSSGTGKIITSTTYTPDGRFVSTKTDDRNKVTTYSYDTSKGILNYVIDANSHRTAYKYNVYKAITDVFADIDNDNTIDDNEAKISYVYDGSRNLTQIVTRTSTYNLSYDTYGNIVSITIGASSTPFVEYEYANYNGKLTKTEYANGNYFENVYDYLDRVISVKYNGTVRYSVSYSKEGYAAIIYDVENGIEYQYEYDRLGRLIRSYEIENGTVRTIFSAKYDNQGRTTQTSYKNDGYVSRSSSTSYNTKGRISMFRSANNDYVMPSYDSFGRVSSISYYTSLLSLIYTKSSGYYTYSASGESRTASVADSLSYSFSNNSQLIYRYTYDDVGNLNTVFTGPNITTSYQYDNIDQLTKEYCNSAGKVFEYSYDLGGNITNVKEYDGNTLVNTDYYSYTNTDWPDQLTSYNNHTITYDALGNPLSYYNGDSYTFTWKDGRKLATLNRGNTSVSYKYNNEGYRFEKTVNGVVHKYYLFDSNITAETIIDGNNVTKIEYFNDENGSYAFSVNGTMYYYVKSIQGDVLQIRDTSGNVVVEYIYDAWGRVLSITGSLASTIGELNPIRFHGYYYDTESGLYYLTQRYYDPQIKRFISPDSESIFLSNFAGVLDTNLYAFCDNNPVMRSDDDGGFWHILAGAVVGAIGGAVSSIISQAISGQEINWKAVAISSASGALSGAITAACPCMGPIATGLVQGTISAATYAATEKIAYGRTPSLKQTLITGVTSGVTAGCMKYVAQSLGVVNCFVAGTLVAGEHGNVKIEDIRPGDLVWSSDPENGVAELKLVTQTFENETEHLVHIKIGGEEIVTTPFHPFYSPRIGWTDAVQLRAGDILVTVNGEFVVVEQVQHEILENPVKVYNFEVEDYHTYYVGENGLLVHNKCGNIKYKALTKNNYRYNALKYNNSDGIGKAAHHMLPQKFRSFFEKRGINIDSPVYIKILDTADHIHLHSSGYNNFWKSFIDSNPNATFTQIIDYMKYLWNQ